MLIEADLLSTLIEYYEFSFWSDFCADELRHAKSDLEAFHPRMNAPNFRMDSQFKSSIIIRSRDQTITPLQICCMDIFKKPVYYSYHGNKSINRGLYNVDISSLQSTTGPAPIRCDPLRLCLNPASQPLEAAIRMRKLVWTTCWQLVFGAEMFSSLHACMRGCMQHGCMQRPIHVLYCAERSSKQSAHYLIAGSWGRVGSCIEPRYTTYIVASAEVPVRVD
jgi:hypothetical protein